MSNDFSPEVKVEKNVSSLFNALSRFETLAGMLDKSGVNAQFIPFFTNADKAYFCTTVMGKKGVVSMKRGDKDFNNAVHLNADGFLTKIVERQFDTVVNNLSNPKMVAYSVSPTTGMVVAVTKLYNENGPFIKVNH